MAVVQHREILEAEVRAAGLKIHYAVCLPSLVASPKCARPHPRSFFLALGGSLGDLNSVLCAL